MQQGAGLGGDRFGHHGMGMTERGHTQAAEEIEVALTIGIPQLGAAPPDEHHLGRPGRTSMNGQ